MVFCWHRIGREASYVNMPGDYGSTHPDGKDTHHHMHPHGNAESQEYSGYFLRLLPLAADSLFVPGLEVHPIFIYIYGMMEIRETSEKKRKTERCVFWLR